MGIGGLYVMSADILSVLGIMWTLCGGNNVDFVWWE